mmetsp:Transcript_77811/g.161654  ORF Transcript_77811/g.161654 Transcript_77811/m.161654 type:complete len:112 (-) Transcript_77811:73-408(-)
MAKCSGTAWVARDERAYSESTENAASVTLLHRTTDFSKNTPLEGDFLLLNLISLQINGLLEARCHDTDFQPTQSASCTVSRVDFWTVPSRIVLLHCLDDFTRSSDIVAILS